MTSAATAPTTAFLLREDLDRLLDALRADGRMVVGPTVRDGAVIYDEIASADALPVGWRSDVRPAPTDSRAITARGRSTMACR